MGALNFRLRALDETSSTNDEVKRAIAAGEAEGLAVRAVRQTGGYGRQGRTWASPEGGLYLSVLLRPQAPPGMLPTLSLAVGIAARRALASLVPSGIADAIQLKWPNDIVVAGAGSASAGEPAALPFGKLCGISLEGRSGAVCAGIGVNVACPASAPVVDGRNAPVYLADLAGAAPAALAPATVCDAVLEHLSQVYGAWCAHGLASLLDEYNRHAALAGRRVRVEDRTGGLLAQGAVLGVDSHGCLVLADGSGTEVAVGSGEAHLASVS